MFFFFAKIFYFLARPGNFLVFAMLFGLALASWTRFRRLGLALAWAGPLAFIAFGLSPLGHVMIGLLEDRFPRPALLDPAPDGIVVLGGMTGTPNGFRRGVVSLADPAERVAEVAALARLYPKAKVIYTGATVGGGALGAFSEAEQTRKLFLDFGIAPSRIMIEDASRDTWENAVFTKKLVDPQPGSRWLIVTSAWHMPRSIGIFRRAGWPQPIAFPVDYHSPDPDGRLYWNLGMIDGLDATEKTVRELIGLVAYRMAGRTDELFPAP